MAESSWDNLIEGILSCMTKGRVANVMAQRDGLCQFFIETKGLGDGPCNLRNFKRMGQSCPVVISRWCEEDLCFVFQPSERLGMDDPIPIMLKGRPEGTLFFKALPPLGHRTKGRKRREDESLPLFQSLSNGFTHLRCPCSYSVDKFLINRLCCE